MGLICAQFFNFWLISESAAQACGTLVLNGTHSEPLSVIGVLQLPLLFHALKAGIYLIQSVPE